MGSMNGSGRRESKGASSPRSPASPLAWFESPVLDGWVVSNLPVDVSWGVRQSAKVTSQKVYLLDDGGDVVASKTVENGARSTSIGSYSEVRNNRTYAVRLDIYAGDDDFAIISRSFSTRWAAPASPCVSVVYDGSLAANISVEAGASGYEVRGTSLFGPILTDEPHVMLGGHSQVDGPSVHLSDAAATTEFDVSRVDPDGSVHEIASGVKSGQTVTDPLPPLNTWFQYMVTAYSETSKATVRSVRTICRSRFAALNFGYGARDFLRVGFDAAFDFKATHSRKMVHFASGMFDSLPLRYDVAGMDVKSGVRWTELSGDRAERAYLLSRRYSWGWFRDLDGHVSTVATDIGISRSAKGIRSWSVSVDMVESVWEDPDYVRE